MGYLPTGQVVFFVTRGLDPRRLLASRPVASLVRALTLIAGRNASLTAEHGDCGDSANL
jgi:hypothetical protein